VTKNTSRSFRNKEIPQDINKDENENKDFRDPENGGNKVESLQQDILGLRKRNELLQAESRNLKCKLVILSLMLFLAIGGVVAVIVMATSTDWFRQDILLPQQPDTASNSSEPIVENVNAIYAEPLLDNEMVASLRNKLRIVNNNTSSDENAQQLVNTLNWDDLQEQLTEVVLNNDFCNRKHALARSLALLQGLNATTVYQPDFVRTDYELSILGNQSSTISICPGDVVQWTLATTLAPNNVNEYSVQLEKAPNGVVLEQLVLEQLSKLSYRITLEVPGTYEYYCELNREETFNIAIIVR